MRTVAFAALIAVSAGALAATSASAGCYDPACDDYDYHSAPRTTYYRTGPEVTTYYAERPYHYDVKPEPAYRVTYYDRTYYERPVHYAPTYKRTYYDRPYHSDRPYHKHVYYDRPYYRPYYKPYYRPYYKPHYYSRPYSYYSYHRRHNYRPYYYSRPYYRPYHYTYHHRPYWHSYHTYRPTVYYGGALLQTYAGYPYGCHKAYIPYGWTWYRAYSC